MKNKPNVVLLVMDTVRADHLSCYGYQRKTTPNIDNLAKRGVVFENAFSAAPWTPPSHASIFTGKYPSHHRTIGNDVYLKKENTTLAQILKLNGYQTIGITCCGMLSSINGFNKGFQRFLEMSELSVVLNSAGKHKHTLLKRGAKNMIRALIDGPDKGAYHTNEVIRKLLQNYSVRRNPFFLFINYFECHAAYDPPKPFKTRFCSGYKEPRLFLIRYLMEKICGRTAEKLYNNKLDIQRLNYIASGKGAFSFLAKELHISKEEWKIIKSWYDGEIAYLDHRIKEFVDILSDEGIFDKTILIITSDHGENFGEHGLADHPFCLYDNILRVPLIIIFPSLISEQRRIPSLVSTIDLLPTILDILELKDHVNNIDGKSLYPFEERKVHDFICAEYGGRPIFSKIDVKLKNLGLYYKLKGIRTNSEKYILSSEGRDELYNIQSDPLEQRNIVNEYPKKAKFLREQLEKTINISFFGPKDNLVREENEEIRKRLKALGYI